VGGDGCCKTMSDVCLFVVFLHLDLQSSASNMTYIVLCGSWNQSCILHYFVFIRVIDQRLFAVIERKMMVLVVIECG